MTYGRLMKVLIAEVLRLLKKMYNTKHLILEILNNK